jgi:hypothetical protein
MLGLQHIGDEDVIGICQEKIRAWQGNPMTRSEGPDELIDGARRLDLRIAVDASAEDTDRLSIEDELRIGITADAARAACRGD